MATVLSFLSWLGVGSEGMAPWLALLLLLVLVVVVLVMVMVGWMLVHRAARSAWQAKSEAQLSRARAIADELTADKLRVEALKARALAQAELAQIESATQSAQESHQRELSSLRGHVEQQRLALGERDAALVLANQRVEQALVETKRAQDKLALLERDRLHQIGEYDELRQHRDELAREVAQLQQRLSDGQRETERLQALVLAALQQRPGGSATVMGSSAT